MPTTVNGIGTKYYGKKDLRTEPYFCQRCGRQVQAESYETRLWFVVLYIPVIPLGRKQILDQCPLCTYHKAASTAQWKEATEASVREAGEQFTRNPDDPEAALVLLGTLSSCGHKDDARQLAAVLAERFADDVDVQLELAVWHARQGNDASSDACFARALGLKPDHPMARRGVAIGCIERGELPRAAELLAFMEQPGAGRDPQPLLLLADAYGRLGDPQQALRYYDVALEAWPELGKDKALRKRVAQAERAVGRRPSRLPAVAWHRRPALVGGLAVLVLAAAILGASLYAAGRQTLHVVNALGQPARVALDGGAEKAVGAHGRLALTVAEGKHQAIVRREGAEEETIEFEIRNGPFQRFSSRNVFVLNVAAAAAILWEEAAYAAVPNPNASNPYRLHAAEPFLEFRQIDYPFQEFPQRLQVKNRGGKETRRRVEVLSLEPIQVLNLLVGDGKRDEALRFAEVHLKIDPHNDTLADLYGYLAIGEGQTTRARDFLAGGLQRRPVAIGWHRMYQEMCRHTGAEAGLPERYRRLLAQAPNDSALLYLAGRLCERSREAIEHYDRAIAADPRNPYPYYAKGQHRAAQGDWQGARELLAEAARLRPEDPAMGQAFFEARLGCREEAALINELRNQLKQVPHDSAAERKLVAILGFSGKEGEARQVRLEYLSALSAAHLPDPDVEAAAGDVALEYALGDFDACRQAAQRLKHPAAVSRVDWEVLLEQARPQEAEERQPESPRFQGVLDALVMSLAWQQKSDPHKAEAWRKKALEAATGAERRYLGLLEKAPGALRLEDLGQWYAPREVAAATLVLLAGKHPQQRDELLKRAETLNIPEGFPYHFLDKAIKGRRGQ